MANEPYLPEETISKLYTTSQMLSGIAPTAHPSYLHYAPVSAFPWDYSKKEVHIEEHKVEGEEKKQQVDPMIFSILVNNEINKKLKKNFGIAFVAITCLFTLISYAIIILASVYEWKMPAAAMTALIVQAPLQMVGILFVMARNLFPTVPVITRGKQ